MYPIQIDVGTHIDSSIAYRAADNGSAQRRRYEVMLRYHTAVDTYTRKYDTLERRPTRGVRGD